MNGNKGFTLFEMMVVAAIIAVVSAFAIPGMREMGANSRISATAKDIEAALAFAKSTAATTRRSVVITTTATAWQVRQSTSPVSVTGTVLQTYPLPTSVVVTTALTATPATAIPNFQFTPTGFLQRMDTSPPSAVALTIRACDSSITSDVGRSLNLTVRGRMLARRDANAAVCNP